MYFSLLVEHQTMWGWVPDYLGAGYKLINVVLFYQSKA